MLLFAYRKKTYAKNLFQRFFGKRYQDSIKREGKSKLSSMEMQMEFVHKGKFSTCGPFLNINIVVFLFLRSLIFILLP